MIDKNTINALNSNSFEMKSEMMNDENQYIPANSYIAVEPEKIDSYLSQIPINPFESIKELIKISDKQYMSIPEKSISDIMTVLSNTYSSENNNNPDLIILRNYIFLFFINIADKSDKEDRSFCIALSNPTYISLIWKDFPNNNYSTRLLSIIVEQNPSAAEYIIHHVTNIEQIQSLMSANNPLNIIKNTLLFFSSAFSTIDTFIPNIMNLFIDFTCNIISTCLANILQCNDSDDFDDLLENAEDELKKMIESYNEVATRIVNFLPTICIFNELDSTSNMNTNFLLKATVEKLNSYQVLLIADPSKVLDFILRCFDISNYCNDLSLFSVLQLLTAVDDYSPFISVDNFSKSLFEKLALVISRNERYKVKENAVLAACGLIKCATQQQVSHFLSFIDFSLILDFAEEDKPKVQKSILEAIIKIDFFQRNSNSSSPSFICSLFGDDEKMKLITELTKSPNDEISHYANMIIEQIDY